MFEFTVKLTQQSLRSIQLNAKRYELGLQRGKRRAFSRVGAFIRRRARSLIGSKVQYKTQPRIGGSPPRARVGSARDFKQIIFLVGPSSVRIGPVKYNQANMRTNPNPGSVSVPELHEFGGTLSIEEEKVGGKWRRRDLRRNLRPGRPIRKRAATYPARPFMGPALNDELANPKLMDAWGNILGPPLPAVAIGPGD